MKTFHITVSGKSESDIEIAIEEVKRIIDGGSLSGFNSNETGEFEFSSEGKYEPYYPAYYGKYADFDGGYLEDCEKEIERLEEILQQLYGDELEGRTNNTDREELIHDIAVLGDLERV